MLDSGPNSMLYPDRGDMYYPCSTLNINVDLWSIFIGWVEKFSFNYSSVSISAVGRYIDIDIKIQAKIKHNSGEET